MPDHHPRTRGAHHVGLTVPDVEAARAFFVEALGFEVVGGLPDYPVVFASDGTTMLTLWRAADPAGARVRSQAQHRPASPGAQRPGAGRAHGTRGRASRPRRCRDRVRAGAPRRVRRQAHDVRHSGRDPPGTRGCVTAGARSVVPSPGGQNSPFHAGERAVQRRLGVRDEVELRARKVVRDHLPEQHRAFYPQLPFVGAAARDAADARPVTFVHGVRDARHHPLKDEVAGLARRHPDLQSLTVHSRPPSFLADIGSGLAAAGVPATRIHVENF